VHRAVGKQNRLSPEPRVDDGFVPGQRSQQFNAADHDHTRERNMTSKQFTLLAAALFALGTNAAQAGPCTTAQGKVQDAGAGPTPGNTGQAPTTTGVATSGQHPPTGGMSNAAGAASSDDTHKQGQGQPTAAQQAAGASTTGQDC
jgi:hypothetical protein